MNRFAYGLLMLALLGGWPVDGMAARKKKAERAEVSETQVGPKLEEFTGHVLRVLDGDTLVLATATENDVRVRLLDINTPEVSHDGVAAQPYAKKSADALRRLVFGQQVTVRTGPKLRDQYGRTLGHVFLANGGWVNGTLVRDGYAHVYTFPENAVYAKELMVYEAQARAAKRGIWGLPEWRVRTSEACCAREDIGTFKLVEGKVLAAAHVKTASGGRTYLNFGSDWKRDFSVFIGDKDVRWFKKAGIKDIEEFYKGKVVRVRGYLQPVNGVLVRVTHPGQIDIVE